MDSVTAPACWKIAPCSLAIRLQYQDLVAARIFGSIIRHWTLLEHVPQLVWLIPPKAGISAVMSPKPLATLRGSSPMSGTRELTILTSLYRRISKSQPENKLG